jgi:hypothetical protein
MARNGLAGSKRRRRATIRKATNAVSGQESGRRRAWRPGQAATGNVLGCNEREGRTTIRAVTKTGTGRADAPMERAQTTHEAMLCSRPPRWEVLLYSWHLHEDRAWTIGQYVLSPQTAVDLEGSGRRTRSCFNRLFLLLNAPSAFLLVKYTCV